MHLLICYDVNTLSPEGRKRLRKVAQACQAYGQRVQYSVFECTVNATHLELLRQRLVRLIHPTEDSLRIYFLGERRQEVVEVHGRDHYVDFSGPLIV